MRDLTWVVT